MNDEVQGVQQNCSHLVIFSLLSDSTHANCKSWDVFGKFRKFAT